MHPTWTWWAGLAIAAGGAALWTLAPLPGLAALALGAATLALRALAFGHADAEGGKVRLALLVASEVALLGTLALLLGVPPLDVPWTWKAALLGLALQLVLTSLACTGPLRPARLALLAVGQLLGLWAAWAVATGPRDLLPAVGIAYAAAFTLPALAGLWPRREKLLAWEPFLLGAALCALAATGVAHAFSRPSGLTPGQASALVLLAVLALAVLASPPRLFRRPGTVPSALLQGGILLLLLNAAFVPLAVSFDGGARVALAVLAAFVLVTVLLEYAAVRHLARSRRIPAEPAPPLAEPVTVVVAARNEAQTLKGSLEENLRLPETVRFLLVVSGDSRDGTVDVARAAADQHPERVRVHVGAAGSKAGDMNEAWRLVGTDLVLVLDADETIDAESLARGVRTMRDAPRLGILQGRKVSRDPEATALARFVSTERRHSTSLDHPLYADGFQAGHFAGSAALLRREVPPAVGGWSEDALTEDVDLTMRVHLETDWRIAYDARMVVRESDPLDVQELLRQRTRWARGWAQCFVRYFPLVLARRRRLGARRAAALAWMLFAAVSAPLFTLLPAMVVLRLVGSEALLPLAAALPLALLVLPARLVSYTYGALVDPHAPVPRRPGRLVELALHAYAWVVFGWIVQLHAVYLELASAPRTWAVTRKRAAGPAPPAPGRASRAGGW